MTRTKRVHPSDEARIRAKFDALPSYRYTVSALSFFDPNATSHELRMAAERLGIDHRGYVTRADYVTSTARLPLALLKRLCERYCIATRTFIERDDFVSALQALAVKEHEEETRTCPICFDDFRDGQHIVLLLCEHEFHMDCAVDAALAEYKLTREFPRCTLCRRSLRSVV